MLAADSALPTATRRPRVRRLVLADFRSYASLDLDIDAQLVALTGDNGAGKTNVLEALSLFTPGRGLRRADLADMAREGASGGWAVSIEAGDEDATMQFGTGYDPREAVAFSVLAYSIHARASQPVCIAPIMLSQLGGVMTRERHPLQSTDFSFSRFQIGRAHV